MLLEELRKEIVFYGQQMLKQGLTKHTGGNLSVRDPNTGLIAIKPTSIPYELIRPEDVSVINIDGEVIEGKPPSSEWPMHTLIFKRMPQVGAIVHTHSFYATACSVAGVDIPLISHELAAFCSEPVKSAPFEIPGTVALGESALQYLKQNDVVILSHHGPLAVGVNLWHAFDVACAVEQAAFFLFAAKILSGEALPIPQKGLEALRATDPFKELS